jgi:phosphatidylserine decarboxylase
MKYAEPVAREGWVFIAVPLLLAGAAWFFQLIIVSAVCVIFSIFSIFFFRNPARQIPDADGLVVSPADGKIMWIDQVVPDAFSETPLLRISIFLSIFNVHINRIPIAGRVVFTHAAGGSYLPAWRAEASRQNVRRYLGLNTAHGPVLVVQITGLVARRIVNRAKPGEEYLTGERFGLIRFGSCTEVYLPLDCEPLVQVGQKVKGGESILARFI